MIGVGKVTVERIGADILVCGPLWSASKLQYDDMTTRFVAADEMSPL